MNLRLSLCTLLPDLNKLLISVRKPSDFSPQKWGVLLILIATLLIPFSSGCGWFLYEDDMKTRAYYDIFDDLRGVQDEMLLMCRFPTAQEIKKNVFIPMNEYDKGIFQGPVQEQYNEAYFRLTGRLIDG